MYRLARNRGKSEVPMSGDDKLDSSELEEPEIVVEPKRWISSAESQSASLHGDGDKRSSTSAGHTPLESVEPIENDDLTEIDEEVSQAELISAFPEITTAQELLNLPKPDLESLWTLLVKRLPVQRPESEWKEMKALTFDPSNRFRSELDSRTWLEGDDGLFVGSPLSASRSNVNRLKQRLWNEAGISSPWFSDNGNFILSDPYRPFPLQLVQEIDEMMQRLVIFRPAEVNQQQYFHHRQLDPYNRYEITLEIDTLQFYHHPFFSKEHVLAEKLKAAFQTYSKRLEENESERFEQKLRALRDTVRHTKTVAGTTLEESALAQIWKRLEKYRTEMENIRVERDESFRLDRQAMKSVLDRWKQLKKLRREQQYSSTDIHLKILSLEVNKSREKEAWKEEIEHEFQDVHEAFTANYERQMRVYRRKLRRWTKGHRVPAEKPFEVGDGESTTGSESFSLQKPVPPSPFQEAKVREDIAQKFAELKRLPGEPKVIFEIEKQSTTPNDDLPTSASGEVRRRKATESSRLQFRVWYNMKTNYSSEKRCLNPAFSIPFHVSLKLPIREVPECLHLELRQDGRTLHVIELPIPNSSKRFDRTTFETLEFVASQDEVFKTNHAGVGAGTKFTILAENYDGLAVSGDLSIRYGWSSDDDGTLLCPRGLDDCWEAKDDDGKRPSSAKFDKDTGKWTNHDAEPDPNDPKSAQLNTHSNDDQIRSERGPAAALKDGEFCDWSEIENSKRLRLLFLRDQEVPEFKNMRMIPANEAEILPDVFEEYEKRLAAEASKATGETWKEVNEAENFNEWDRLQPIRNLRSRMLESFVTAAKQITFEDLVIEEQIPDIGTLGLNLMSIFQPRRPLRPLRKERKRIQTTLLIHTEIQLVVNIVRAINLPLRKDSQTQTLTTEALTGVSLARKGTGNWAYGIVKPFVEVWFQRKVSRTTTALGTDPTWNQELQIPLILEKDDYSESILSRLEEDIYLQVYDEVAIDLLEDERRRETDVHQRLEKRWLGCIRIPFATLYHSGRIEGTFPLNCPPILLGYEGKGSEGIGEAYLTLFITLQPTISPPPITNEICSVTGESNEMLEHVKCWMKELQNFGKIVRPFVLTPNGDTVLASRYLAPIEPPEEIFPEGEPSLFEKMEALAHYVSLFPSLPDSSLKASQYLLWFTPDVFISTPGGGREDHSILLASFFLYLGVKTYIVQGESIEGPTTHLLTLVKKSEEFGPGLKGPLLWNPLAGTHSRVCQAFSSLHTILTVIGQYNIWGNVSLKERPDEIDWEIEKSKDWLPLFPKGITEAKLPRLVLGNFAFSEGDDHEGNRLGQKIERHLRESFMKWRQSRTTWNRYSSTKLRSLLPLLEERRVEGSPSLVQDDHLGELREIMKSFEMTGFPLHQPYSTLDSIIESVYATGLHTIDTPDVQFALGAFAKAYPASIFSLWVYIAALHPIK